MATNVQLGRCLTTLAALILPIRTLEVIAALAVLGLDALYTKSPLDHSVPSVRSLDMGIHSNLAALLRQIAGRRSLSGTLCTLGVQDFSNETDGPSFYVSLGFSAVETLDVSGYEGADLIFDLNAANLPRDLEGRYGTVFNGGTIEHVFHIPNALTSITRMLRVGGYVIHQVPTNGYVDHGFYQISPTLLIDYYASAEFEICESMLCSFSLDRPDRWTIRCIRPGDLGMGNVGSIDSGAHLYLFMARKTDTALESPIPTQRLYSETDISFSAHWFRPHAIVDGQIVEDAIEVPIVAFSREIGCCYTCQLPESLKSFSNTLDRPAQSPLTLLEDGIPIGMAHSAHDTIRRTGMGAYSHWNNVLYFSTSDNLSAEGRLYSVILPPHTV